MSIFSERYGYIKPSDVIIREEITPEIQNVICSCFDRLDESIGFHDYMFLQRYLWMEFLNQREGTFQSTSDIVGNFIQDDREPWYRKLDMIEVSISFLVKNQITCVEDFVNDLNQEFARLHFAYRVVDRQIVEVTSKDEFKFIEDVINATSDQARKHLEQALRLYGRKPQGDYTGSIKESISAVGVLFRHRQEGKDFEKALCFLKERKIAPDSLDKIFSKLYACTIDESMGNHLSMNSPLPTRVQTSAEALFILVSCCAFINYWEMKCSQ